MAKKRMWRWWKIFVDSVDCFACVHESIVIVKNLTQTPMPIWQQDWMLSKEHDGVV